MIYRSILKVQPIKNISHRCFSSHSLPPVTLGGDKSGYAHYTMTTRVPKTIQQVIDDVDISIKSIQKFHKINENQQTKDGNQIKNELNQLIQEVLEDKPIPLLEDSLPDKLDWNREIEKNSTYLQSEWMLSETYIYRRMKSIFSKFHFWNEHDFFQRSKIESLASCQNGVSGLANWLQSKTPPTLEHMIQLSLWGNKGDLAFFLNRTEESMSEWSHLNHETLTNSEKLILDNQSGYIADVLQSKTIGTVDIILDNSGLELVNDLILSNYLIENNLAFRIFLHYKSIPWFVSDVTLPDLHYTMNQLMTMDSCKMLYNQFLKKFQSGHIVPVTDKFWTLPHYYPTIPSQANELLDKLNKSDLLIFKGDLNYRKLVNDRQWDPTTKFRDIVEHVFPKDFKVASIRTCKSDFVSNMDPSLVSQLDEQGREWRWEGKYGMIQFNQN